MNFKSSLGENSAIYNKLISDNTDKSNSSSVLEHAELSEDSFCENINFFKKYNMQDIKNTPQNTQNYNVVCEVDENMDAQKHKIRSHPQISTQTYVENNTVKNNNYEDFLNCAKRENRLYSQVGVNSVESEI